MDFIEGIKTRRSIRNYKGRKVAKEQIEEIIEIARFAPTWKNSQTPKYFAVMDYDLKTKIANEELLDLRKIQTT